ncbi:MAG: HEAT repeat domain-containing protein [Pyrinomonadaceae bacterium]
MTKNLKRTIRAAAFCASLLLAGSYFLFQTSAAREDPIELLLRLPAPPPPNPFVGGQPGTRDEKFYDKNSPPNDNASIIELLDYWQRQNNVYAELRFNAQPSDKTLDRLMKEIGKKPSLLTGYLNLLKNDAKAADFVKELYDRESAGGAFNKDERKIIKEWLTYNSPYFSSDLARKAANVTDSGEYLTSQGELLSLARVDFEKAKPIIDRLTGDSSLKASRVLAKWALYRHALDTNSTGDIETYRDDLKAFVEDKTAMPGMRDLALDALSTEKEWAGRDEWYYSLLADETLAELKVNGGTNTGLTTLILVSPDEKYIDKMIELAASSNPTIRSAAVRNLVTRLENGNPKVLTALLPWLEDPKWALDINDSRATLVRKLSEIEMPESVLGLIKIVDERNALASPNYGANMANAVSSARSAMANVANQMANAMAAASNRSSSNTYSGSIEYSYPFRSQAVVALAKQKDTRAVPVLRRILPEAMDYERDGVVGAILACGGFSLAEQLDALDTAAKGIREEIINAGIPASTNANTVGPYEYAARYANEGVPVQKHPLTAAEIRAMLAQQLLQAPEITDVLARAAVDRIEVLDTKNPPLAAAYRRMILKWQNSVINILLLRDVKRGIADADTMIRLLGQRKTLREKQSTDIFDIRTGKPSAFAISACLLEDTADYDAILETGNAEMKTALFACARLLRLPLPVTKVAENLKVAGGLLPVAAERYLEAEDSPEARAIVLERHPNEAKILGSRSAFAVDGAAETYNEYLYAVYQSIGDNSLYNGWSGAGNDPEIIATEKDLQNEVKKTDDLIGLYAYDGNYIRIYKDRVMFSWDEDTSRYRERALKKEEFDEIKEYLASNRVDELPPFLTCGGAYCTAKELVMLSRNGGRRVYVTGDTNGYGGSFDFFTGLVKQFETLKQTPAKLKYQMSREIPGLEIVLAADDLSVAAVWKDGSDLRVAASQKAVREKVISEIEDIDDENLGPENYEETAVKKQTLREKRRYEGYAWYKISNGSVDGIAAQPPQIDFFAINDGLGVPAGQQQWKARTATVEIRTSDDGLFKVVQGKLINLRKGRYDSAVVTPNGRWVIAKKFTEEAGFHVVRVDLLTNKEYPVVVEGYGGGLMPSVYIPTLNKVLVVRDDSYIYEYGYAGDDDISPVDTEPESMFLIDAATGAVQPIAGEFRPLAQQTYRPLQKTSKPNEFWAAMADEEKNSTSVGIYDTKTFGFKTVLRVPRIKFNSMNLWVDETEKKIYFVYRGHLLSLPLP